MNSKPIKKYHCNYSNNSPCYSSKHSSSDTCLVKGYVTYEDGCPVVNCILILEPLNCDNTTVNTLFQYTTTNNHGEYCFLITNTNISYKVKVFNNGPCKNNCNIICE